MCACTFLQASSLREGNCCPLALFKMFLASVMKYVRLNVYVSQTDLWLSATAAPANLLSARETECAAICVREDKAIF